MPRKNWVVRALTPETTQQCKPERKFSAKSTATEAQYARILAALEIRPHNSIEFRRWLGCLQIAARIMELRGMGYDITTDRITITDDEGFTHPGVALYSLVAGPEVSQ